MMRTAYHTLLFPLVLLDCLAQVTRVSDFIDSLMFTLTLPGFMITCVRSVKSTRVYNYSHIREQLSMSYSVCTSSPVLVTSRELQLASRDEKDLTESDY